MKKVSDLRNSNQSESNYKIQDRIIKFFIIQDKFFGVNSFKKDFNSNKNTFKKQLKYLLDLIY